MSRTKQYINLTESKRFSIAVTNPINNWRIQRKQTQLVSQASSILLQRHAKFWTPLLKSLNLSSNFTPYLFHQIFNRIESRPQICLQFFKWVCKNIDFTPDLKTQCRLTRILFDSGLPKLGKPILDSLIQDHPPAKIVLLLIQSRKGAGFHSVSLILNSVAESYCSKQMYLHSLQIYQKAVESGVGLNLGTCNSLLNLLVDKNELRIAWCFYASITKNGVLGDQFTWSLIARILCKDGKFERVSMILEMGIYTPVMFNLMIDSCSKRGDFEAAFDYLNKMCSEGIEPSLNTYGSVLDAACKFQDTEVIESVLHLILVKGYLPELRGSDYDLIIQKVSDLGSTYAVDLFFKKVCDEKIELQHSTYGCMLGALLSEQGRVRDAIKLYNIIQEKEILLTEICYNKFVAVLCQENPSQGISKLLIDIIRGEFCPATIELSKYIRKLCSVGRWREAEELWNLVLNQGCLIDSSTCGTFVKHYCCNRRLDSAILLHDKLAGLKSVLEIATYNVFLAALLKEKRIEEATKVFGYMKGCKMLSSESFSVMIRGLCHENELRKAMKLHDEMLVLGYKPDRKTYKRLISGFRRMKCHDMIGRDKRREIRVSFQLDQNRNMTKSLRFYSSIAPTTLIGEERTLVLLPMAISLTPCATVFLLLLLLLLTSHALSLTKSVVSDLSDLQSQSSTGVIHLTDPLLRRILALPTPRSFHFLIFFDAKHLHSKPELSLPTLKNEFSLVSSTFQSNNPNQKSLFFFEIEFGESQASFALFGINSLPHIRLGPPSATDLKADTIQMEASDFSRLAESMAEFIESRTKLTVGPINRPPVVSKKQIFFAVAVVLIWTPFFLKKLIAGNTFLHDKNIWMAGAIFVYFFSVSGAMFNIIRKMPMFMMDRQDPGKLVFFYQGSGMQLGAEGFAVGFLYTIVGLLLAFVTHAMVRLRNKTLQRVLMIFVLFTSFWAVRKVVFLDNWKTGYGIHGYWPSSWR